VPVFGDIHDIFKAWVYPQVTKTETDFF